MRPRYSFVSKIWLVLTISLNVSAGFAQTSNTKSSKILDSLKARLYSLPETDTSRYSLVYRLAAKTRYNDAAYAINLLKQNITSAQKTKGDSIAGYYYEIMGDAYWHLGKYDSSIISYQSALNIYSKEMNMRLRADVLASIGYVLMEKGDLTAALSHLLEAHQLAEATKSSEQSVAVISYLAILYERMGNWNKALEMHRQTALHYQSTNNKYNLGQVYSNIGQAHFNLYYNDSAKFYFYKAITIFSDLGEKKGLANIYLNLSEIEKYEKNYVSSLNHVEQARKNFEEIGDAGGYAMSLYQSGDLHFETKDFSAARNDFEKCYSQMRESGNTYRLKATLRKLGQCYFHLNDLQKAWKYQEEYIRINDSLYSAETAKTISELGEKYESRLRKTEIENLKQSRIADQKEIEKQNLQKILFAVGLACVLALALVFYRNYRNSQKQKKLIEEQKNLVEEKQKEILDSIYYARRIQRSLLTSESYIRRSLAKLKGEKK